MSAAEQVHATEGRYFVHPDEIARIAAEFAAKAERDFEGATAYPAGLKHFAETALLPHGKIEGGPMELEEITAIARWLVTNFDHDAVDALPAGSERDRLLEAPKFNEHLLEIREELNEARRKGPVVIFSTHPTVVTPGFHLYSLIEMFGPEICKDLYTVIGPYPACFQIGEGPDALQMLRVLSTVSNNLVTGPASGSESGQIDLGDMKDCLRASFKYHLQKLLSDSLNGRSESHPIILVEHTGTQASSSDDGTRNISPVKNLESIAEQFIHPGITYVLIGTDDDVFARDNPGIVSPVHRKASIVRIVEAKEAHPEPAVANSQFARDSRVYEELRGMDEGLINQSSGEDDSRDDENERALYGALYDEYMAMEGHIRRGYGRYKRMGVLQRIERNLVALANQAAIEAGKQPRYKLDGEIILESEPLVLDA